MNSAQTKPDKYPPRIVIIGAGFAGLSAAKGLASSPVDIVLIDRKNHHVYKMIEKSIGYQSFNLYGLALLKKKYRDHHFWKSGKCRNILHYLSSESYFKKIEDNKYGFPYNVTGIENAFVAQEFDLNETKDWVDLQFAKNLDWSRFFLSKNTDDPFTLAARIYEATRISDLKINL